MPCFKRRTKRPAHIRSTRGMKACQEPFVRRAGSNSSKIIAELQTFLCPSHCELWSSQPCGLPDLKVRQHLSKQAGEISCVSRI